MATTRRSGLGKGLGSLIPNAEQPDSGDGALRELAIELIRPNRYQPRGYFDDEALGALTDSIRSLGVLQPILVRPSGDHFELIAGERRWRAAKAAGLQVVPALVRDVDDTVSLEQALVENLHREDLSVLEEAAAFQQLADEFDLSHEQIGQRVGKSRSAVANAVRLLQLPTPIQKLVNDKSLSAGHARALLPVNDTAVQQRLAERIVRDELSVRETEDLVRDSQERGDPPARGRDKAAGPKPAGLLEIEDALSEHLDTRVQVTLAGKERGKIVISFAGFDDLDRIYRVVRDGREPAT